MDNRKKNCILLFPGQGSQVIGMGRDFFENFSISREIFEEADSILSKNLTKIIFEGPESELADTSNSQVALMVVSIAILKALEHELGFNVENFGYVIGHSLGEYSALVAAKSFSFADTVRILNARANAMKNAVPSGVGGMLAIIGLSAEEIEPLCNNSIAIANYNCPGQVVVSGLVKDFDEFEAAVREKGCRKIVRLNVSGPFHSKYMSGVSKVIEESLNNITKQNPIIPIISNVSSFAESNIETITQHLVSQVTHTILFKDCIDFATRNGITTSIEIGSGKVLTGLVKRCNQKILSHNVSNIDDMITLSKSDICC